MKLIALAIIAAGLIATDQAEIPKGQAFEAPDDIGAKLIASGDAKEDTSAAAAKVVKTVKGRVLTDGAYGKANDVIDLAATDVKSALESGQVDTDKAAVAYALTLPQNQPKPAK